MSDPADPLLESINFDGMRFGKSQPVRGLLFCALIPVLVFGAIGLYQTVLVPVIADLAEERNAVGFGITLALIVKLLLLAGLATVCGLLWKAGKRAFQRDAGKRFFSDPRRPILYLRPFSTDSSWGFRDSEREHPNDLGAAMHGIPLGAMRIAASSQEADFISALNPLGPSLAIGRPGEFVPAMGAPRLYVPNDQWQATVKILAQVARLVFVQAGTTEGMCWELEHLRAECDPTKLVIFFAPTSRYLRQMEIRSAGAFLGVETSLEGYLPEGPLAKFDPIHHTKPFLIGFNQEWEAVDLPVKWHRLGSTLYTHLDPVLHHAEAERRKKEWKDYCKRFALPEPAEKPPKPTPGPRDPLVEAETMERWQVIRAALLNVEGAA